VENGLALAGLEDVSSVTSSEAIRLEGRQRRKTAGLRGSFLIISAAEVEEVF
jgi:hypothetical protein